jgi:hypothetical protein
VSFKKKNKEINIIRREYALNLDFPESNEGGIWAQLLNDVVFDKKMYNVIAIQKPCYDPEDYDLGKFSAELLDDGSGIVILTEPSAPHFMLNDVAKIYGKEDKRNKDGVFSKMFNAHSVSANKIRKMPNHSF